MVVRAGDARGLRCATPDSRSAGRRAANDPPRVALIMKSLANEFFVTMAEGAKAHQAANARGYTLLVNGIRNESDLAQQVALVEQMMAQGVDAIVIAPADSGHWFPCSARPSIRDIVVVNIDNKLDAATLQQAGVEIPFVGPDNRAGARAVGDALADASAAGDKVAILEGIPTAFNAQQRRLGFEDAMHAAGIVVVDVQSAHWEQDEANAVAAAMMREHPGPQGDSRQQRQHGAWRGVGGAAGGQDGQVRSSASTTLRPCVSCFRTGVCSRPPTSTPTARGIRHRVRARNHPW